MMQKIPVFQLVSADVIRAVASGHPPIDRIYRQRD